MLLVLVVEENVIYRNKKKLIFQGLIAIRMVGLAKRDVETRSLNNNINLPNNELFWKKNIYMIGSRLRFFKNISRSRAPRHPSVVFAFIERKTRPKSRQGGGSPIKTNNSDFRPGGAHTRTAISVKIHRPVSHRPPV